MLGQVARAWKRWMRNASSDRAIVLRPAPVDYRGQRPRASLRATLPNRGAGLVALEALPDIKARQILLDLHLFAVEVCLRAGTAEWWLRGAQLPVGDIRESVRQLKEVALFDVLQGAGDLDAFCEIFEILEAEGWLADDAFSLVLLDILSLVRALQPIPAPQVQTASDGAAGEPPLVFSVVVPNASSMAHFRDVCLPSLDGQGELAKLCRQRRTTFLAAVNESQLSEFEAVMARKRLGCLIVVQSLPAELCEQAGKEDITRDWLVDSMRHLHMVEARHLRADLLPLNSNAVYSKDYIGNLGRVATGQQAVLSAVVWLPVLKGLERKLLRSRFANWPNVAADAIVGQGLDLSASTACSFFEEGFGVSRGRLTHLRVTWRRAGHLEVHTSCHEILFLSQQALLRAPDRFYLRLGAEMEVFLGPAEEPRLIRASDDIAIGEIGWPPGGCHDVTTATLGFHAICVGLERRPHLDLLKRAVCLPRPGASQDEPCEYAPSIFLAALEESRPAVKISALLTAMNVLSQFEMSEYGPENLQACHAEGRRLIDLCPAGELLVDANATKALIRSAVNLDYLDKAFALAQAGGPPLAFVATFLAEMARLSRTNEQRAKALRDGDPSREMAVLGSVTWGEAFVDRFVTYHLPSLLASGNLPAVAKRRRVVHSVVTTERDRQRIEASPIFAELCRHVDVVFTCFPEEFISGREEAGYNFYHFLGLLDHQNVRLASCLKAELYLLPPDIVLSRDYLSSLARNLDNGADACSTAGVECAPELLKELLDAAPRGSRGELDLPWPGLLERSASMPDAYARSLIMNRENTAFCRHPRELVWPIVDGLRVHSIFLHPVAVSSRLMSRPFVAHNENVDYALLPRLLQADGNLEVPEEAGHFTVAQFGAPAGREEFLETGFSLGAFMEAHNYNYAVHRHSFRKPQHFACASIPYAPTDHHDQEVGLLDLALTRYRFGSRAKR